MASTFPVATLLVLGVAATIKTGINGNSYLGNFTMGDLLPFSSGSTETLTYLAAIVFIFTGIEMPSVYIPRFKSPLRTYLRGIFLALVFMSIDTVLAMLAANVVSRGTIELNNIAQAPALFVHPRATVLHYQPLRGVGPDRCHRATVGVGLGAVEDDHRQCPSWPLPAGPALLEDQQVRRGADGDAHPGIRDLGLCLPVHPRAGNQQGISPARDRRSTGAPLWYQGLGNALILIAITTVLTVAPLVIVRVRKES